MGQEELVEILRRSCWLTVSIMEQEAGIRATNINREINRLLKKDKILKVLDITKDMFEISQDGDSIIARIKLPNLSLREKQDLTRIFMHHFVIKHSNRRVRAFGLKK